MRLATARERADADAVVANLAPTVIASVVVLHSVRLRFSLSCSRNEHGHSPLTDDSGQNRFQGCECHKSAASLAPNAPPCCVLRRENDCPCRKSGRACDPRLCSPCECGSLGCVNVHILPFSDTLSVAACTNMQFQQVDPKATIFTLSSIPNGGYGCAVEPHEFAAPLEEFSLT